MARRKENRKAMKLVVLGSLKAKFRYTILVADRSEAGRRLVVDLLARC